MSLGSPALDRAYDVWKTTPPEDDMRTSRVTCSVCGECIYPDEEYYDFEGEIFCKYHGEEHFQTYKQTATYEDCYGDYEYEG